MFQDFVYAARLIRKSLGFSTLIIGTLALGIGANTAVFSIVDAVLLRPLPYRDPGRLNLIFETQTHNTESKFFVSYRHFQAWAERNRSYSALAAATWARGPRFLAGRGAPQSILGVPVTVEFFSVLGVPAQLGRTFA